MINYQKKCKIKVFDISSIIFKGHKDTLFDSRNLIKAQKIKSLPNYLKKIKIKSRFSNKSIGIREENIIFDNFKKNIKMINFINNHLTNDYFFLQNYYCI